MTTHDPRLAPGSASRSTETGMLVSAVKAVLLRVLLSAQGRAYGKALNPGRSSIEGALRALTTWTGTDPAQAEHVEALDQAIAQVTVARDAARDETADLQRVLADVEAGLRRGRDRAIDQMVIAQGHLRREAQPRAPKAAPFSASAGVPSLHRASRRVDSPVERTPAAMDDERMPTPDELLAGVDEAETEETAAAGSAGAGALGDEHDERFARDCLETIAGLSGLRRRAEGGRWDDGERIDQRLLASLDALVALAAPSPHRLGGAPFDLPRETREFASAGHADRGSAFACAFVLGCLDDEDAVRDALLSIRLAYPDCRDAARDALGLASSPAIRGVLSGLLRAPDAAIARFAIDVLRVRREVGFGALVLLLRHPDRGVVEAAARALGAVSERDAAVAVLEAFVRACDDDQALLAALESLIELGAESAPDHVRRSLAGEIDAGGSPRQAFVLRLTELLAIAGSARDLPLVQAAGRGTIRGVTAMGWFGHAAVVPALIEELSREGGAREGRARNYSIARAAAFALFRVLGEDPRIAAPATPERLFPIEPTLDAEAWGELWKARAPRFDPSIRHRFGKPYVPLQSVDEIRCPSSEACSRSFAALEIRALVEGRTRLELSDWVARQRREIARLAELAPEIGGPAGEFVGDRLRRRPGGGA